MNHRLLLPATAAILMSAPAFAVTIGDAVKADMPSLMAMYRDFHANPELSMQEVRTPAKLAAETATTGGVLELRLSIRTRLLPVSVKMRSPLGSVMMPAVS